jgi:Lectin C-type domain
MRHFLLLGCALAATACLRTTQYRCEGDTSCGAGGVCETSGFCSTIDTECDSGRRYGESAGTLSGTCTTGGGNPQDDADVNPMIDMGVSNIDAAPTIDGPMAQCPNGYATIAGGNAGHQYMFIAGGATWAQQEAACNLTAPASAHLAVPDDIGELTALDTLAGGTNRYWIGVSDSATENTFVRVTGGNQTFLPWDPPAPDDAGPGEDCVEAIPATHEFNDERCNTDRPAVCECAP